MKLRRQGTNKIKAISGGNLSYPSIPLNHHTLTISAFVMQIAVLLSEFPCNYLKLAVASPLSNISITLETSIRKATIRVRPLLGAFGKRLQRAVTEFVTSVRPSTWNTVTATERILVKFRINDFYLNLSTFCEFVLNLTNKTDTLYVDLRILPISRRENRHNCEGLCSM